MHRFILFALVPVVFLTPNASYSHDDPFGLFPHQNHHHVLNQDWKLDPHGGFETGDHYDDSHYERSVPWDYNSIKATIRAGENLGASASILFPEKTEGVFVSYCLRFADNWKTYESGGKLPGFAGNSSPFNGGQGGNPSIGSNAWSARMMFGPSQGPDGRIPLGFYVYHTDQSYRSNFGDVEWWATDEYRLFENGFRAERNRWYLVKQHIRINDPWSNNGVLQGWIDGEMKYSRNDFNFTNSDNFREVYRFWLNLYHGGSADAPNDMSIYIDQFTYSFGADNTQAFCLN